MHGQGDGGWDELERGFFEAAPPDVPGPAPEAPRFDDLDPIRPARPARRSRGRSSESRQRTDRSGPLADAHAGAPARARTWRPPLRTMAAALAVVLAASVGAGAYLGRDRSASRAFLFGVGGGSAVICQTGLAPP